MVPRFRGEDRCLEVTKVTSTQKESEMENTIIKVTGMTCMGCVKSVTNVLTALPGVDKANVNLEAGTAAVAFNPQKVSVDQLKNAVRGAGFEAG
jgi:copper chaperone